MRQAVYLHTAATDSALLLTQIYAAQCFPGPYDGKPSTVVPTIPNRAKGPGYTAGRSIEEQISEVASAAQVEETAETDQPDAPNCGRSPGPLPQRNSESSAPEPIQSNTRAFSLQTKQKQRKARKKMRKRQHAEMRNDGLFRKKMNGSRKSKNE